MECYFEWDDHKARLNLRKHGVRMEEAALVFDDPLAVSEQDRIDEGEFRWRTVGLVSDCVLLVVAHTWRLDAEGNDVIRIISARRANRKERKLHEQGQTQAR
jgi:uncharacterized DUF497 family protein